MAGKRGRPSAEDIAARNGASGDTLGNDVDQNYSGNASVYIVDPTQYGSEYGDATASSDSGGTDDGGTAVIGGKKRGRKPGSVNKTKKRALALDSLAGPIFGIHAALAAMTKVPEIELDKKESEALSDAIVTLSAEYDVTPNSKIAAWIGLASVTGMIYGPRYLVIKMRLQNERNKARNYDGAESAI